MATLKAEHAPRQTRGRSGSRLTVENINASLMRAGFQTQFRAGDQLPAAMASALETLEDSLAPSLAKQRALETIASLVGESVPSRSTVGPTVGGVGKSRREADNTRGAHVIETRSGQSAVQFHAVNNAAGDAVVRIEAANIEGRAARWNDKVAIQISRRLMPAVAAVVLGDHPQFKIDRYGPSGDKGLLISRSNHGNALALNIINDHDRQVSGVISGPDLFWVQALFVRQLAACTGLSDQAVRRLIRDYARFEAQHN